MKKIYKWYGSRPIEKDLYLVPNDDFWRPRGKLIWGCPEGIKNNWYNFVQMAKLDLDDPCYEEKEIRFLFSERFEINDYSKILTIDNSHNLDKKYVKSIDTFIQEPCVIKSYKIDFDKIQNDGFCGFEVDFESFGGIPQEYFPWSVSSIAIWNSSVIHFI